MRRREAIKTIGGATFVGTFLAGCTSAVTGGLQVISVDAENTALGNVILTVRVENTASSSRSGELFGQVEIDGGDTYSEIRSITVRGNDVNDYELDFDIALGDSLSGSSYTYSAEIQ